MICYKDRTFCVAACAQSDCDRKLTEEVREDARRWWAGFKRDDGAPISMANYSARCTDYQPLEQGT